MQNTGGRLGTNDEERERETKGRESREVRNEREEREWKAQRQGRGERVRGTNQWEGRVTEGKCEGEKE